MRKLLTGAIVLFIIAFLAELAYAQNIKIGVVNVEEIAKAIPETAKAEAQLKELAAKYQDSMQTMKKMYAEKMDNYEKQQAMMNADQKKKEQDALRAIESQYAQFQDEKFGVQGELAQLRVDLLEPIRKKIMSAIEVVAKEQKLNFVLDKTSSVVLYAEDKFDITYKVLDKIKTGIGGGE